MSVCERKKERPIADIASYDNLIHTLKCSLTHALKHTKFILIISSLFLWQCFLLFMASRILFSIRGASLLISEAKLSDLSAILESKDAVLISLHSPSSLLPLSHTLILQRVPFHSLTADMSVASRKKLMDLVPNYEASTFAAPSAPHMFSLSSTNLLAPVSAQTNAILSPKGHLKIKPPVSPVGRARGATREMVTFYSV